MNKRSGLSFLAAAAALLLTAPAASAATEAGWPCTANDTEAGWTLLATGSSGFPMPPSIPAEGPKVITGWKTQVGAGLGPIQQRLEVFEVRSEYSDYEKIGESAMETLVEGTNSFATRIPVDEGDSVGLYGPGGTLLCAKEGGAISMLFEGAVATGETKRFKGAIEVGTPVVVTVEDDWDGDGYGDETQDRCLANAAYHDECPSFWFKAKPRREVIVVTLRPVSDSRIGISCGIALPPAANGDRRRTVRVSRPATTVAAGDVAVTRLQLPRAVRQRLRELPRRRSLRAKVAVRTTAAGKTSVRTTTVELRGRQSS